MPLNFSFTNFVYQTTNSSVLAAQKLKSFLVAHYLFLVLISVFDAAFLAIATPSRSFGGDFWLHLWLIHIQAQSIESFGLPALLASFEPVGNMSTAPLFTGGAIYTFAGLIETLGLSSYWSAMLVALISLNISFIVFYYSMKPIVKNQFILTFLSFSPISFAFTFSDGFGRGGLSSMIGGLFAISTLMLIFRAFSAKNLQSPLFYLNLVAFIFFSLTSHLPSAVIFLGFAIPLLGLTGIFWVTRTSLKKYLAVFGSLLAGAGISFVYLYPILKWAIVSSAQAQSASPFQLDVSEYFASPFNLWNFVHVIPEEHKLFWTERMNVSTWTTLSTTLPVLLFISSFFLLPFVLNRRSVRVLFGLLIPLGIIICLLCFPNIWTHFPYSFQSLQYSFRVSYLVIPWLTYLIAIEFSLFNQKLKKTVAFLICLFVVISGSQSILQLKNTSNLSILPISSSQSGYFEDIPPEEMLTLSSPKFFWYAASEQQAVDSVNTSIDGEKCTPISLNDKWKFFPGQTSVEFFANTKCIRFSMNVPLEWLDFSNALVLGRTADFHEVLVEVKNIDKPVKIGMKNSSPFVVGAFISTVSLLFVVTFFIIQIVRINTQRKHKTTKQLS